MPGTDSRRIPQGWSILLTAGKSEQSSPAPNTVCRAGRTRFLLNCWTTNSPPGPAAAVGGRRGNKAPAGLCRCGWWEPLTCQTHRSLLHPSWAQVGKWGRAVIAWYVEKLIWNVWYPQPTPIKWLVAVIRGAKKYTGLRSICLKSKDNN